MSSQSRASVITTYRLPQILHENLAMYEALSIPLLCPYTEKERGQNRSMLSQPQFGSSTSSASVGAMPINSKFDGASTLKTPETQGVMSANSNVSIPKPGFS